MQPGSESKRTRQVASRYLSASAKQQQEDSWGDATTPRSRASAGPWVTSASAHLPGGRTTYVNMDPPRTQSRSMGPPPGVGHHSHAAAKALHSATPRSSSSMSRAGSNDITPQPDTARRHASSSAASHQQQRPGGAGGSSRSGEAFISPGSSRNSSRCTTPRASAWAAPPSTPGLLHTTSCAITPLSARATPAGQRLTASTGALGLGPPSSGKQRGPDPRRAALEEYQQQKKAAAQGGDAAAAAVARTPGDGFRRPSSIRPAAAAAVGAGRAPGQPAPRRQTMLLSPGPTGGKAAAASSHQNTAFTATAAALSQQQSSSSSSSQARVSGSGPAAMDSAFTVTMAALKETGSGSKPRRAAPRPRASPGSPGRGGTAGRPGSSGRGAGAGSPGGAGSSSKTGQRPASSGGLLQQVSPVAAAAAATAAGVATTPAAHTGASQHQPPASEAAGSRSAAGPVTAAPAQVGQLGGTAATGVIQQQQQPPAEALATPTRGPATAPQQAALAALASQSALTPSRIPTLNLGGLTPQTARAGGASRLGASTPPLTSRAIAAAAAVPLPDQGDTAWEAAQVPLPDATPRRRHSMATAGLVTKPASGMLTPRQQQQQQTPASSSRAQGALLTPRQRQQVQAGAASTRQAGTYARPSPGGVAAAAAAVLGRTPRGSRAGEAAASPVVPRLPLTPRQALSSSTSSMAPPPAKPAAGGPSRAPPPPRAPASSHSGSTLVTPRGSSGWSYPVAGAASRPSSVATSSGVGGGAPSRLLEARREAAEAADAAAAEARLHAAQLLLWRTLNCRLRAALAGKREQAQAQCGAVALAVCGLQGRVAGLSLQLQQASFRTQLAGACRTQLPTLQGWAQQQGEYEERLAAVHTALRGALSRVPLVRGATAGAAGPGGQPDAAALLGLLQQGRELLEGLEPGLHLLLGKAAGGHSGTSAAPAAAVHEGVPGGGEGLGVTAGMAGQLVGVVREECGVLAEVQALLGRLSEACLYANSLAVQAEALRGAQQEQAAGDR